MIGAVPKPNGFARGEGGIGQLGHSGLLFLLERERFDHSDWLGRRSTSGNTGRKARRWMVDVGQTFDLPGQQNLVRVLDAKAVNEEIAHLAEQRRGFFQPLRSKLRGEDDASLAGEMRVLQAGYCGRGGAQKADMLGIPSARHRVVTLCGRK